MSRTIFYIFGALAFILTVEAQDMPALINRGFTPMGMNGMGYNPMMAARAQAAVGQDRGENMQRVPLMAARAQTAAGQDRGENMQRVPLALQGIQSFPGMFQGGFPGGYQGFQGGFSGAFPGAFQRSYGRNPMFQNDIMQERRSNLFSDMAMAAVMTGNDMWTI